MLSVSAAQNICAKENNMGVAVDNPAMGYIAFVAIKAVGYTAAALYLNRKFGKSLSSALKIGVARLLIGMLFGLGVWGALWIFASAGIKSSLIPVAYILLLFPVRCLEWHLLFNWFYKKEYEASSRKYLWLLAGTLLSYVLDIPAAIGWIATAGFWVC
jgi:hypothetical protein